ncbi:MAG: hypothetical protein AAGM38_08510 [Pseudomonadota bacterium]
MFESLSGFSVEHVFFAWAAGLWMGRAYHRAFGDDPADKLSAAMRRRDVATEAFSSLPQETRSAVDDFLRAKQKLRAVKAIRGAGLFSTSEAETIAVTRQAALADPAPDASEPAAARSSRLLS